MDQMYGPMNGLTDQIGGMGGGACADVDSVRRLGGFRTKSNWLMGGDVPVSDATEGYRRKLFRTTASDSQRDATSGRTPNPPERIGGDGGCEAS